MSERIFIFLFFLYMPKAKTEIQEISLYEKLGVIQHELKAPKGETNNFGKYKYRNVEGIYEAVKPLLAEQGLVLRLSDELVQVGERYYIKATASLTDGKETIDTYWYAREEEDKKGMDGSQITGASSSYARKYALCGLFLIDWSEDSDALSTKTRNNDKEFEAQAIFKKYFEKVQADNPDKNIPNSKWREMFSSTLMRETGKHIGNAEDSDYDKFISYVQGKLNS